MSVTRSSNWQIHLPAGVDPAELDLLAAGSLPAAWRRQASEDPGRPALWAAGPALLCYTSGTTGAPKGAVLAHGNLLASAEALRLGWRWGPGDRLVLALPLFHIHGLGVGLHGRPGRDPRPPATLFFGCRPCTPGWPPRRGRPNWAGCGGASPGRPRCPRRCSSGWPSGPVSGSWSATA